MRAVLSHARAECYVCVRLFEVVVFVEKMNQVKVQITANDLYCAWELEIKFVQHLMLSNN